MKRKSATDFIYAAYKIYGNKYDYSNVKYVNSKTKVKIHCNVCNADFEQTPDSHLQGHGCPVCANNNKKNSTKDFIERSNYIYYNKYNYSKVEYKNSYTKVCIICPEHGEFWQKPYLHLQGHGCKQCANNALSSSLEEFVIKANKIHNNKYDYSKTNYTGALEKLCIICPKHGEFWQRPSDHLRGSGCPHCHSSKGEIKIRECLIDDNIIFEEQKKFVECRNKDLLSFDFYLPDYNLLIEYQGEQHYIPIEKWGGLKKLIEQQKKDNIKREFCKNKNINLLEICYKDYNGIRQQIKQKIEECEKLLEADLPHEETKNPVN